MMQTALVPFKSGSIEDSIDSVYSEDTKTIYCIPRRICEVNLHLSWSTQYQVLIGNEILRPQIRHVDINTPSAESGRGGGIQNTLLLTLKGLPIWLLGIKASKVHEDAREKLLAFQMECVEVLYRYWLGDGVVINPREKPSSTLKTYIEASQALLAEHSDMLDTHEARLDGHDQQLVEVRILASARAQSRVKRWQRIPAEESQTTIRELLMEFAGGSCLRCGCTMTFVDGKTNSINIDEVVPCAKGGWRNWDNIQPLCARCNRIKHEHTGARWDFRPGRPSFIAARDAYLAYRQSRHDEQERQLCFMLDICSSE
jgi:5-methylcytosine-specific restriction endonuclease McrA